MSAGDTTLGEVGGGVARALSLARGKVNELNIGKYKICYATKHSVGESNSDFKMLSTKEIEILPTPATHPSVSAPRSIILGQDIVVSWASNVELSTNRSSHPDSWLGLFVKDSCVDTHDCYIAWQSISANDYTGTVIFSQSNYKNSGEYEVRYFKGSIHNGASQNSATYPEGLARETGSGVVCRGLSGVPSETYITCNLEMATQSETIYVMGSDIDETEDLSLRPGLEAVFGHGNRGRYHRTKLT